MLYKIGKRSINMNKKRPVLTHKEVAPPVHGELFDKLAVRPEPVEGHGQLPQDRLVEP